MKTRIKICGLRDAAGVRAAVSAGADAVGFVFVEASPRCVTVETAGELMSSVTPLVDVVGLFVDTTVDDILATARKVGLGCVQLHGEETVELADILQGAGLRVIKALPGNDALLSEALRWAEHCDALLIDAPPPAEAPVGMTGGSGVAFDWSLMAQLEGRELPARILAGGLTVENVDQAVLATQPYAVDVSSGVESARGVKDADAMRRFCAAVRQSDVQRFGSA